MDEEDPPPPYSLVEQPLQPSVDLKPPVAESALSAPISEPGVLYHSPALGPSPNTSFRASHGSASNVSSSADLDLSPFKAITKKIKRQLVTLEDLKTHLRMLEAFRLFKEIVEDPFSDPEVARVVRHIHIDPKGRWLWFLEMAVERFRRWVTLLATSDGFFVTPPVDVWLIWHTYMLNPMWYMEDCERLLLLRPLKKLNEHPMELAAIMGDDILNRPTGDQEGIWEAGTDLPFDPFASSAVLTDLELKCPRCKLQISTPLVDADDTGFAQAGFLTVCPSCHLLIARETLGVSKFIQDIVLDPKEKIHGKRVYLPGTLLEPSGLVRTFDAGRLKSSIKNLDVFRNEYPENLPTLDLWTKAIGERLRYSTKELRKSIEGAPGVGDRLIRRMLGAYTNGNPFSVDLVAAAMRQSTFVDKIHQLGWLDPDFAWDLEGTSVLQYCIIRYYGFLTLNGSDHHDKTFLVPTLDIDLVWHTHQLAPVHYLEDCRSIAGRFIDHDDQVEESKLGKGLEKTSEAWWGHFGVPYMYCGCPVKEVTVGQRLARASSVILSHPHHVKPPINREDCYAATHPSEHNSVFVLARSGLRREIREEEWKRRKVEEEAKMWKGKQTGKGMETEERYFRTRDHEFPFSSPVTMAHGYGCPHEKECYRGACAVGVSGCAVRTETE